jgi:uncharacterized protein YndB with AHSA1/START domain
MTTIHHSTFTIERRYAARPARVFAAWADLETKRRWFSCADDWQLAEHSLEFRVGGREVWRGGPPGGPEHRNDTIYQDIVADRRILYSYAMRIGGALMSVSLATVELAPAGTGTRMTFTEQVAFVDGYGPDDARERERGTGEALDKLAAELALHS